MPTTRFPPLPYLGEEPLDLLVGAQRHVRPQVLARGLERAAVGLVRARGGRVGAGVLVGLGAQGGVDGAAAAVGAADARRAHLLEQGPVGLGVPLREAVAAEGALRVLGGGLRGGGPLAGQGGDARGVAPDKPLDAAPAEGVPACCWLCVFGGCG